MLHYLTILLSALGAVSMMIGIYKHKGIVFGIGLLLFAISFVMAIMEGG